LWSRTREGKKLAPREGRGRVGTIEAVKRTEEERPFQLIGRRTR